MQAFYLAIEDIMHGKTGDEIAGGLDAQTHDRRLTILDGKAALIHGRVGDLYQARGQPHIQLDQAGDLLRAAIFILYGLLDTGDHLGKRRQDQSTRFIFGKDMFGDLFELIGEIGHNAIRLPTVLFATGFVPKALYPWLNCTMH